MILAEEVEETKQPEAVVEEEETEEVVEEGEMIAPPAATNLLHLFHPHLPLPLK